MLNKSLYIIVFIIFFLGCGKKSDEIGNQDNNNSSKKFYDLNSIFHEPREVLNVDYSKYQKISPDKFMLELGHRIDLDVFFSLRDFRTFFLNTNSLANFVTNSISIEQKHGQLRTYLHLGNPTIENRIRNIYCRIFTKSFRDCKLTFYLEGYEGEASDIFLVIMSKTDKLFMTYGEQHSGPTFSGKHHIDSPEFAKDTIEAYRLYKADKDAPSLRKFGYSDEEIEIFEKKYQAYLKEKMEVPSGE